MKGAIELHIPPPPELSLAFSAITENLNSSETVGFLELWYALKNGIGPCTVPDIT